MAAEDHTETYTCFSETKSGTKTISKEIAIDVRVQIVIVVVAFVMMGLRILEIESIEVCSCGNQTK
jgi:hypothetical protein